MGLKPVTSALALPLDWSEVAGHLRLGSDETERPRIESVLIPAAREWVENFTGRALITQTWTLSLNHFPGVCPQYTPGHLPAQYSGSLFDLLRPAGSHPIELPKPPLAALTSIKYIDADGVLQTFSNSLYTVDPTAGAPFDPVGQPHRIWPAFGASWPVARAQRNAIEIEFVCGYGDSSASVPGALRQAMLMHVAEAFETRESSIQIVPRGAGAMLTAERLAWPYRVRLFPEVV